MLRTIRQYDILEELGSGHFGTVYAAVGEVPGRGIHPGKRRIVAIKKLRDPTAESVELLLQEFALLEQVKHRSVVRVFEYLADENAVVMELVHGLPLRTVLETCEKKREQVFTEAAIEIGCELADALYQAWTTPGDNGEKLQLVHRDLKPENVMVTPQGEVKILDFGLARVDNADFRRDDPGRIKGTPLYMAPEQARGDEVDHRSDLFALGLILYELLMNRPAYRVPMDAPDPLAAIYAAIEGGELSEQCKELESKLPGIGQIVARLLQGRPRNRYQTGHDLLVDLRRQLYKDRGAYLKEFCDFFYGSLYRLRDLPDADTGQGGRMSNDKGRKSIEDRLRESMTRDAAPPPEPAAPRAPVPVRRSAPSGPPQAVEPEPSRSGPRAVPRAAPMAAPTPAPAPAAPKIVPRTASAARPAPAAEDDDGMPPSVKGARPGAPGGKPTPRKMMGARSPDETGMLQMVPLSDNDDEKEAGHDPSATAFFAIPAPKSERPKSVSQTMPPPSPTPMQQGQGGGRPAFQAPGYNPNPMAGPQSGPPPTPQPLVQGPIVSYGGAQGGPTPFQVAGPTPTANTNAESRVQSVRVYAIVLGVFALACVAVLSVLALWFFAPKPEPKVEPVAQNDPAPKAKKPRADTGAPAAAAPAPAPTRAKTPRSSGGGTAAAPAAPKLGATADVRVTFAGSPIPQQVEVVCSSGFRQRKGVSGNAVTIPGVPTSDSCQLHPKGGITATAAPVKGGGSYSCSIIGTTTSCK